MFGFEQFCDIVFLSKRTLIYVLFDSPLDFRLAQLARQQAGLDISQDPQPCPAATW